MATFLSLMNNKIKLNMLNSLMALDYFVLICPHQ